MIPQIDLVAGYESIKEQIDRALLDIAKGGRYILGQNVKELEDKIAEYCGCRYGVGVASGTDALLISLVALGVGPGDEVITTPFSFIATADAIVHTGATPVFVDIDPKTFNINTELIESALTPKTKAILPVHLYGQSANMIALMNIASRHNLRVVEDAAQAIGAEWQDKRVGSFGDAGALSFFPTKNLGCFGDGGMIVTNDSTVAEKARILRIHGASKKYIHDMIGFNSRLDEIQAAVLLVKLKHLDRWTEDRRCIADIYNAALESTGITTPFVSPEARHVYNQYTVRSAERDSLAVELRDREIATTVYYPQPLHRQKALLRFKPADNQLPEADRAAREVLSLPMYPEMSKKDAKTVAEIIFATCGAV